MTDIQHEIIFIVDDNRLQAQGLLLAASLRDHLGPKPRMTAYTPQARLPQLNSMTMQLFAACGVELRGFDVPRDTWRKPYPHGNKIIACADAEQRARMAPADGPRRITFMDSDMICQGDFLAALPDSDHVLAVPEGKQTWGKEDGEWQRAYGFFNLPLPPERVRLVRAHRIESLPYFNAGLVSFPVAAHPDAPPGFAAAWLDTARRFDHCPIANKRPWLDQITLPLTLYRSGLGWTALSKTFNYSASDLGKFAGAKKALVLHYHKGANLDLIPKLRDRAIRSVRAKLPDIPFDMLQAYLHLHLGLGSDQAPPAAAPAVQDASP